MSIAPKPTSALLIVGHGSTENPDSSAPYFEHADEIRRLVARGKASGMIREAGTGVAIKKNGTPVTATGTQRTQWMDIDPGTAAHWLQNNFGSSAQFVLILSM